MKQKILVADDEECIRLTFFEFLSCGGYQVQTVDSLMACREKMREESFDLLFLDISIGRENGIEAIEGLKMLRPDCSVVIITGAPDSKTITTARRSGAADYLAKPIREQSLMYIAKKILASKPAMNS